MKLGTPSLGLGLRSGFSGSGGIAIPALDLNFINGEALDGRITASGGVNGTRVNSAGLIVPATAPRFDYDPVTLAARGLLIEGARTNYVTQSEAVSGWSQIGTTLTANTHVAPDGATTADTAALSGAGSTVYRSIGAVSGSITYSVYAKGVSGGEKIRIGSWNATDGSQYSSDFTLTTSWQRIAFTATQTTTTQIEIVNGTDNAARTVLLWGAQAENGAFATSYIPTAGTQVTRSADVATMAGSAFSSFWNTTEGTFHTEFDLLMTVLGCGVNPGLFSAFLDGNNSITSGGSSGDGKLADIVYNGGASQIGLSSVATLSASTVYRDAFAYKENDFVRSLNGATVQTDASGTLPSPTSLRIGRDDAGTALNGHIRRLRYYRSRLPSASLVQLTT